MPSSSVSASYNSDVDSSPLAIFSFSSAIRAICSSDFAVVSSLNEDKLLAACSASWRKLSCSLLYALIAVITTDIAVATPIIIAGTPVNAPVTSLPRPANPAEIFAQFILASDAIKPRISGSINPIWFNGPIMASKISSATRPASIINVTN